MNAQTQRSIDKGTTIHMSDRTYAGANPQYTPQFNEVGQIVGYTKTTKGIPFVKVK